MMHSDAIFCQFVLSTRIAHTFTMFFQESSDSDSDFEDELQLLALATLLTKEKKRRRYWIHPVNRKRESKGEFHTLVKELESDPERFHQYFRMSKAQFEKIHSLIAEDIKKIQTKFRKPIGTKERLGVCLRFLATGNSFRSMAFSFRMGVSTLKIIVEEVCTAIWKNLSPIVMPKPTEQIWKEIATGFEKIWQFPNCLGALDGKHVTIICPINAGSTYFNYKNEHSIVLLALVDAHYRFIMVDVGAYGRNSDGGIYQESLMGTMFKNNELNVPPNRPLRQNTEPLPYTIVADAAFPLKPYLLNPYSKVKLVNNDPNKIFNYRLSRARRTVENAFGILRARFRVFQGPLQVQPYMADKIVLAACCLHNVLTRDTQENEEILTDEIDCNSTCFGNIRPTYRNPSQEAVQVREAYKNYFMSAEGQVPWQIQAIRQGRTRYN
ncbi:uncharacterized protein LOC133524824 [Cydia pomonella]|uniref:uncharacterized protein LOC133524824 n=1 Tax=Cydia pomonella TaxID=82600 RepID=UPI002ADDD01F|nr:uncharacterized protein LOC133524824 [Cydia pomonella]